MKKYLTPRLIIFASVTGGVTRTESRVFVKVTTNFVTFSLHFGPESRFIMLTREGSTVSTIQCTDVTPGTLYGFPDGENNMAKIGRTTYLGAWTGGLLLKLNAKCIIIIGNLAN